MYDTSYLLDVDSSAWVFVVTIIICSILKVIEKS